MLSSSRIPGTRQHASTWAVAGASLAAGFAVAEITGVRALGGLLLLGALWWCYPRWRTTGHPIFLVAVYAAAFVLSHLLGLLTGAWPAVAIASISVAGVAYRVENGALVPFRAQCSPRSSSQIVARSPSGLPVPARRWGSRR